jgi:hypothetical protein
VNMYAGITRLEISYLHVISQRQTIIRYFK